jgi:uncharacterized protein YdeI (YjbR/CyaY-like superfamily)
VASVSDARRTMHFACAADFERWLNDHHTDTGDVWLQIAKKGAELPSVSYDEALEVALCFGWIDGVKARGDDEHWLQRFTPRSRRSRWSRVNRDKAERLIAEGRMRAPGHAEVQRAQADGRWDAAYEGSRNATIPEDLRRELDGDQELAAAFSELDAHNRYAIIYRLNDAKRPETRSRRLAKYVEMLRRGERLHS